MEEVKQQPSLIVEEKQADQILISQDAIMSSVKQGADYVFAGLKSMKNKAVSATPDEVKENIELSKNLAIQTA